MEMDDELSAAFAGSLEPERGERLNCEAALKAWANGRSNLPVESPQMKNLYTSIELLCQNMVFRLGPNGVEVVDLSGPGHSLILSRGALWFKGGDWQSVVLATVSK